MIPTLTLLCSLYFAADFVHKAFPKLLCGRGISPSRIFDRLVRS
jgi:hypothetical protein